MIVTNIQRFSLHDGPGIRTTVFMKGCSLRCPWCSNPENINPNPESFIKNGIEGVFGKELSEDVIFNEVMKDTNFYFDKGGVTFSGGEPLLQAKEMCHLLKRFKKVGITTAIETCLFVPTENLKLVMEYVDYFYVDMKILDKTTCKNILNGDIELYKRNLELLSKNKIITIRIPMIDGYTTSDTNKKLIIKEIEKYKKTINKIEIIKEHNLGESKYKSLGKTIPKYVELSDVVIEEFKNLIYDRTNIEVEVCKI